MCSGEKLRSIRWNHVADPGCSHVDHFEEWVAARFEALGYSVKLTGMQVDHSIDLLAEKAGEIAAVQCKRNKTKAVGEPVLRDLFGAMQHYGADKGYLVTTGHITQAALDWARGKSIEIWDANYLVCLSWSALADGTELKQLQMHR